MVDLIALSTVVSVEFADIVKSTVIIDGKLRVILIDSSYVDFWWSLKLSGRFAHHWERRHIDGKIFRHDNAPHTKWQHLPTFPQHFHFQSDTHVIESDLHPNPERAVRQFLSFVRETLAVSSRESETP